MSKRKSFLLRIDPSVYDALHKWADDELRSVNGQIEFMLQRALKQAGRLSSKKGSSEQGPSKKGPPRNSRSAPASDLPQGPAEPEDGSQ